MAGEGVAPEWDWELLEREMRPRFLKAAAHCFGFGAQEAEDLAQDVFLRALEHATRVRDPVAYLKAAFHNACLNRLEYLKRRRSVALGDDLRDPRSDGELAEWERRRTIRRAFDAIDPVCRKLIRRHYLRPDASLSSSAREIGYSVTSVWRKIQRCLERMRACLG